MTGPLDKPCISIVCINKSRCKVHDADAAKAMHRQYIDPEATGDSCHFFAPKSERPWGVGPDRERGD